MESPTSVSVGTYLELQIYVPALDHPITIEGAPVRWIHEREFGVEFIRIPHDQQERIRHVLEDLRSHADQGDADDSGQASTLMRDQCVR